MITVKDLSEDEIDSMCDAIWGTFDAIAMDVISEENPEVDQATAIEITLDANHVEMYGARRMTPEIMQKYKTLPYSVKQELAKMVFKSPYYVR